MPREKAVAVGMLQSGQNLTFREEAHQHEIGGLPRLMTLMATWCLVLHIAAMRPGTPCPYRRSPISRTTR